MPRMIEPRSADEAFAWADSLPRLRDVQTVPLAEAGGRMLARDLCARRDVPSQREAAADGFALRSSDTIGAGDYSPQVLAFQPPSRQLGHGEASPVQWGDTLPAGADAVLPLQFAELRGGELEVSHSLAPGEGVAEAGEEFGASDLILLAGRTLRPQDLAWLALDGWTEVPVWRRPVVRLLFAGRYAVDACGPMLQMLVARDGGRVADARATSDQEALAAALCRQGVDVTLVVGGTGDGESDHAVACLERVGALDIHRVAIHPGGNAALGRAAGAAVVLLPGVPLACFAAYDLLGARVLRRLARLPGPWPYRSRVLPLAGKLASGIGRLDLCRVRVRNESAEPLAVADGRILGTAVRADGFVIVPAEHEGYGRGAEVLVHMYD